MSAGIYSIKSVSGDVYIGSSSCISRRINQHRLALERGNHRNRRIQQCWNKHKVDEISFNVLLICTTENVLLYEQRAIDILKPNLNLSLVAGRSAGFKWTKEARVKQANRVRGTQHSAATRKRMSKTRLGHLTSEQTRFKLAAQKGWKHTEEAKVKMRGRPKSEEHRRKLSLAHLGQQVRLGAVHSEDSKRKISEKLRGRVISPEVRARMSAGQKARHNSVAVKVDTGEEK